MKTEQASISWSAVIAQMEQFVEEVGDCLDAEIPQAVSRGKSDRPNREASAAAA